MKLRGTQKHNLRTGLGLAIVCDVATIYGGSIRLEASEDLGGLLACLKLPIAGVNVAEKVLTVYHLGMTAHRRVPAEGRVSLPKTMLDRRGWTPGTELEFVETPDGILVRPPPPERERITMEEFQRRVPKHDGPPLTLEEMDEAIDRAMAERWKAKEARSR